MATKSKSPPRARLLKSYAGDNFFDEMVDAGGAVRPHYARFRELFQSLSVKEFDL